MATVKGDVHDIGKNIVGVVLACNNYEVHRSRRHGVGPEDPRDGTQGEGRHHRAFRPHHALARRDGERGERDGARGLRHSASHRRRHHEPCAHGREDPSELPQGPGGLRHRCEPRRRRRVLAALAGDEGRLRRDAPGRIPEGGRCPCAFGGRQAALALEKARANKLDHRLVVLSAAEADLHRRTRVPQLRCGRARALYRLDAVLPDLGA